MTPSPWTDDRVDVLRRLWRDGLSAREIACSLGGGISRSAVLGKVHRLRLPGRRKPSEPDACRTKSPASAPVAPRARRYPAPRRSATPPRPTRSFVAEAAEGPGLASVLSIGARACRWPLGDPLQEGFSLCGRSVERGAYCAAHGARAYRGFGGEDLMVLARL